MLQIAVFVDAGYLFAQGSTALTGQKQPRTATFLQVKEMLEELQLFCASCAPTARVLRFYWYDGVVQGRLTSVQEQLAASRLCKLRLGLVNSVGEQKGVDSLIVTDMIELARNRAITDAILLAGDEDLRIGVQIAQSFGVQVHLLGIRPARGSQSLELIREADTHHEWDADKISTVLKVEVGDSGGSSVSLEQSASAAQEQVAQAGGVDYVQIVRDALDAMQPLKREAVLAAFKANSQSIPTDLDRTMLPRAGQALGRQLNSEEKQALRKTCQAFLLKASLTVSGAPEGI